ncbi:MAG: alpha/beta hydrolase [Erysipelotrichaceae bacterium]|nr:alpha/beta hydrolase [Erysipelotrichaceae bacterium]
MNERSRQAAIIEEIIRHTPIPRGKNIQQAVLRFRKIRNKKKYDLPIFMKIQDSVEGIESHDLQLFYMNVESQSDVLIIYLHGGSYCNQLLPFHWVMLDKLTSRIDATFIIPDYPLSPHASFLECYDRLLSFYRKVLKYYPDKKIVLMGDSAGGGLALGFSEYLADLGFSIPDKLILLSPWIDLIMDNPQIEQYIDQDPLLDLKALKVSAGYWAGNYPLSDYRLSPIYGDLSSLKEVTLFTGTHELFYPDIIRLYQMLQNQGIKSRLIVGEGLNHVYPAFPIPEADRALDQIAEIIKE